MKGIVIFFSLKEKNRAKETVVDEKGTILVQIQIMILHLCLSQQNRRLTSNFFLSYYFCLSLWLVNAYIVSSHNN